MVPWKLRVMLSDVKHQENQCNCSSYLQGLLFRISRRNFLIHFLLTTYIHVFTSFGAFPPTLLSWLAVLSIYSTYSSLRWLPFADHQFIGCAEEEECIDVRREEFCRHNTQWELLVASRQSWHCTNRTRWNTHTGRIVCWKKSFIAWVRARGEAKRPLSLHLSSFTVGGKEAGSYRFR